MTNQEALLYIKANKATTAQLGRDTMQSNESINRMAAEIKEHEIHALSELKAAEEIKM